MAKITPTVYLLHGDNEFAITQFIQTVQTRMGDPATAGMNTTHLEGRRISLGALKNTAYALPFLASRRLVVIHQLVGAFKKKAEQQKLLALLDGLPPTTALAIVERKTLSDKNWLMKWVQAAGGRAFVRQFALPKGEAMSRWIRTHAKEQNGKFTPQAASLLASLVADDTRLAAQEINKILAYVNYERAVEMDDVDELTTTVQHGNVFQMVDAIGNRNGRTALNMLRILLTEQDALPLLGMIVRQFRLLLLTSEMLETGATQPEMSKALRVPGFVTRKLVGQARNFDLPTLETIYRRLLEVDESIKTGKMEASVALDTLVAQLTA